MKEEESYDFAGEVQALILYDRLNNTSLRKSVINAYQTLLIKCALIISL